MTATPTTIYSDEPHQPHWVRRAAFPVITLAFFVTEIALGIALHYGLVWLAVPLVPVVSHLMHGQLLGFHEASHGLLRKSRLLNEIDGVLLGVFSFVSFSLYRAAHQTHHMHLGTPRDEELWPFVRPEIPRWARILFAILELTFGLFFTPLLFARVFLRAGSPIRSKKVRRRIWAEYALSIVVWTSVLVAVAHWHGWTYFLWLYLAPAFIAANLQSWRKYIEHVGLTGSTVNSSTRSIVSEGWAGRLVAFTLLHEPYHGVHHQQAGLPHAELPRHVSKLEPSIPEERPPFPSYRHAWMDLLLSLGNPRVGAQWNDTMQHPAREFANAG
jgi:fatty acid desaturase